MKLDPLDLALIGELEVDASQTVTRLASRLGTSRATIRTRYERLLAEGVIRIMPIADPLALGYKTRVSVGINTVPRQVDAVANELASHTRIHHVAIFGGRFDIMAWAILEGPGQLSDFIRLDLAQIAGITKAETMVNLKIAKASFSYIAKQELPLKTEPPHQPLDVMDLKLMRELRNDARQTHNELAARLGTSPTTVRRRLQRLLDDGIIRIVAVADPLALGYTLLASVGINVHPKKVDAVADQLAAFPEVHHVLINTGRYDIIVSADFRQPEELSNFVRGELGNIEGLVSHETMMCLKVIKDDFTFITYGQG